MATWHIRWQHDQLRLPDQSFPLARNSMEGRGARVPLAPSERKSQSCKINWRFLAAYMYTGKPCGSSTRGLLSQEASQTTRSSWHTSTLDRMVDSVFPSLGNLLVVMARGMRNEFVRRFSGRKGVYRTVSGLLEGPVSRPV